MSESGPQLDLTSLINAVARLREGLARHERELLDEQLRDGLIQRFEYTMSCVIVFYGDSSGRPLPRRRKWI